MKDKKYEREYLKEYTKLCKTITKEQLRGKRIIVLYDEVIPDLYIKINVNNKTVKQVDYDIYASRIKEVRIEFPNGKLETFDISKVETIEEEQDLWTASWEVPYVTIKYNDYAIDLSLIDLMNNDIKVYLMDYEF